MITKTVGILGGLGPRASANFLGMFIQKLNAGGIYKDDDFPRIIFLNIRPTEFGIHGAKNLCVVTDQVVDGIKWLAAAGADIVAIPCNSVHEKYEQYTCHGIEVLNIVRETISLCDSRPFGVLCSQQTRTAKLYGEDSIYLDEQFKIDAVIESVMRGETPNISWMIDRLCEMGAKAVVLGCTELSLCEKKSCTRVIDSTEALVDALALRL